jgi:hypothetical protein
MKKRSQEKKVKKVKKRLISGIENNRTEGTNVEEGERKVNVP